MKELKGLRNHIAAVVKMESSTFCHVMGDHVQPRQNEYQTQTIRYQKRNQKALHLPVVDKSKQQEVNKNLPRRPRLHLSPAELDELKRLKLCFKCKAS